MINPQFIGRDKFLKAGKEYGLGVVVKRNPARTTDSNGVVRFPNLIKELEVDRSNQVWVSDITYYAIGKRFYYITLIMDLRSRFIVGHHVSASLRTIDTTLPALVQALNQYWIEPGLILHSDGGGQYYSDAFVSLTKANNILNSMTRDNGENNHAERLNGTIKNQYLSWYHPTSKAQLVESCAKAVDSYNYGRPHASLNRKTPAAIHHGESTESALINKKKKKQKEKITTTIIVLI